LNLNILLKYKWEIFLSYYYCCYCYYYY